MRWKRPLVFLEEAVWDPYPKIEMWVHALCRSFCTSGKHLGYLKDRKWRTGSAPSVPKLHLLLEIQGKRQCRGRMEMVLGHPARSPPHSGREMWAGKCQMGSSTEGIWENKLHRELKLTTIMFSEYFLPSKCFPEWDIVGGWLRKLLWCSSASLLSAWHNAPSSTGCATLMAFIHGKRR